jgi:hypothetical protein
MVEMPVYAAHYETACMTRQHLETLANDVQSASGTCRSRQFFVSFSGGHLVWMFEAPDRDSLERWLKVLRMQNHQWLARIDYEGTDGELRSV